MTEEGEKTASEYRTVEERSSKGPDKREDGGQREYPEGETGRRRSRLRAKFGYPSSLSGQHEACTYALCQVGYSKAIQ
jgi:hypothetical protein